MAKAFEMSSIRFGNKQENSNDVKNQLQQTSQCTNTVRLINLETCPSNTFVCIKYVQLTFTAKQSMSKISGNGVKTFFASSFETCCKLDAFHPFNLQYAAKMIIESRSTTKKCKLSYHKKQNDAVLQEMQNSVCFPC